MKAHFAVPGDLNTPTGGYAYARRVLAEIGAFGVDLAPIALPEGFPDAPGGAIDNALTRLTKIPVQEPILLDGLAGGALPGTDLAAVSAPVVMLCHHPLALETGLPTSYATRLKARERAALAACDHVIATSRTTADILVADYGVSEDRLTVARPGTDPAPRARGSTDLALRLLSVGSLTPRKGHDHLITALAKLADGPLAWTLRIVGAPLDKTYATKLAKQIETAGLSDRVALLGALDAAALDAEYARADLFVLASHYEGFGMAFTEAVARGLPVLGIDCAAVAEATLGAALLTPPEDFARELRSLMRDTDRRADLADKSRRTASKLPRWSETAKIIAQVLQEARP
ncbi:MAG: glycosyltransferase family 4 protein [Pseudomonadota bacterium]